MTAFFAVLMGILIFVVIFQIAKASEYVSVLKGEKSARAQANKINGFLVISFLVLGLFGVYFCNEQLKGKLLPRAASIQGVAIDHMMNVTIVITGIVFFITQILLFTFAYRFQASEKRKAKYFPEDNRLELAWTIIPALAMTVLVGIGLKHWFELTSEAPKDAMVLEVTGHQFNWFFRYPGKDGELGKKDYQLIDPAKNNPLGQDWSDPANQDDVISTVMHLVVNRPVKLIINSQDVVHDVGLPYFRLKMDAMPGIPTTLWFTPTITTSHMALITGDDNFTYKLICDQLCGKGHYSMVANIIVETQPEYDSFMAQQKPEYQIAMATVNPPAAADSTSKAAPADSSGKPASAGAGVAGLR
jgi:cytochrome c oxidase subunit 2